jgi:hypothetical protein
MALPMASGPTSQIHARDHLCQTELTERQASNPGRLHRPAFRHLAAGRVRITGTGIVSRPR